MNQTEREAICKMLSRDEARDYYNEQAAAQRAMKDMDTEQKLNDLRNRFHQIAAQQALYEQAQTTPPPKFRNAERASLAADGIVIEAGNGMERIVVRGDLLKTLATLVTMAQMAGLLAKDDETLG